MSKAPNNIGPCSEVEYNGRQGFVTTYDKDARVCCVWFLVPPKGPSGHYRWISVKDLKTKPKINPLRIDGPPKSRKTGRPSKSAGMG